MDAIGRIVQVVNRVGQFNCLMGVPVQVVNLKGERQVSRMALLF